MRLLFFIPLFTLLLGQQPNKYLQGIDSREKNMDVTDRKYGDHTVSYTHLRAHETLR